MLRYSIICIMRSYNTLVHVKSVAYNGSSLTNERFHNNLIESRGVIYILLAHVEPLCLNNF